MLLLKRLGAGALLVLALGGCAAQSQLEIRERIQHAPTGHWITVYTQDKKVYQLRTHTIAGSTLRGVGTVKDGWRTQPFDGEIPLDQVAAVSTSSPYEFRNLAMIGIAVVFVAYLVEGTRSHSGVSEGEDVSLHLPPSSGGGTSCPSLYAWDGKRYVLEAEPFAVAWGRAFETTTAHLLADARSERGSVRLRVADERQEAHYLNSVRMRAIDLGTAPAAVLDTRGDAWAFANPAAPSIARDAAGHDLRSRIARADGRTWECDPTTLTAGSRYEDVIEVAFARPGGVAEGLLAVTAVNTDLFAAVYGQLCRLVGDQAPLLAHAVETDPELIAELRDYLTDASLALSVWNGRAWEPAGSFLPEGNAAPFTRGLRLGIPEDSGDTVRVRLRSMADVWRLDAVAIDWGPPRPLRSVPLELRSATGPAGENLKDVLAADDDRRAVLLPPDHVDLSFAAPRRTPRSRWTFVAECRGYLMEWIPPTADDSRALPEPRIESLKRVFRDRNLALLPVYEEWRRTREK